MDSGALRCIYWITLFVATLINGMNADKILSGSSHCEKSEFWNRDVAECVPCSECKQYPKTPSCDTCPPIEPSDSWRVAAITSLSVLAAVIVFGALIIGVLVHHCRSRRTLREPIEETTGPLYPV
ncbi:tumor necrosis factor receptor superfamily member 12A [Pimephales promelas]|nr:tumor necrosis factor receptor superfamily member 12A [Pimephales promelas]